MKWGAVIGGVTLAALTSLTASLTTMPALAADISVTPRPAPPSTYIPAVFYWTGYYVGLAVGYGWGTAPFSDPFAASAATPAVKGLVAGGVTGINYQIGWAVVGAEADIIGNWVKGDKLDSAADSLNADVYYTASLTGRFGVAFNNLMVFAKAGGAVDFDHDTVWENKVGPSIGTANHAGWTVGGGLEYAMTEHWIGRLEYDYFAFSSKSFAFSGSAGPANGAVGLNLNQIKLVASYKM